MEWTADIMVPYRTGHKTGLQRLTDRVEHIMRTVEENYEEVVIGGRRVTNLRTLLASTQERIRKFFKDLVQRQCLDVVCQVEPYRTKHDQVRILWFLTLGVNFYKAARLEPPTFQTPRLSGF